MYIDRPGIYTDHYELTMAQGYFKSGKHKIGATFDYFFRKNPFQNGYVIFCGLNDLLDTLEQFQFQEQDLIWLKSRGFRPEFLEELARFRFEGTIYSAREGEVVFPMEPVIRVDGSLLEAQIIETLLLNLINFQSLIATKAARIRSVARNKKLVDFGLRRSQGLGGIHASRAAIIGGFDATSNLYAANRYGIPSAGTMAHSWIQSFDSELEAFRTYAREFPDSCTLLIDTYDTLGSGLPNAITVAREMESRGDQLQAVRIDSGDLAYFSRQIRSSLDRKGLEYVQIAASNQLDEVVIASLISQDSPIDLFGVGTRLVTGQGSAALGGVYKVSHIGNRDTFKRSNNEEKSSLPGRKEISRYITPEGQFAADAIKLAGEHTVERIYHPFITHKESDLRSCHPEPLLVLAMKDGKRTLPTQQLHQISTYREQRLEKLDSTHKRLENPHIYRVGISRTLLETRDRLMQRMNPNNEKTESRS